MKINVSQLSPLLVGIVAITYLSQTQPVYAKQYLILENEVLINDTYNTAINAVISSKNDQEKPVPEISNKDEIKSNILQYANQYNIDSELFLTIAICESGLNPNAQNGIYAGLYQFSPATWRSNRLAMSEDPNPQLRFNSIEAIKTAAFKISRDGTGAWPVCSKK